MSCQVWFVEHSTFAYSNSTLRYQKRGGKYSFQSINEEYLIRERQFSVYLLSLSFTVSSHILIPLVQGVSNYAYQIILHSPTWRTTNGCKKASFMAEHSLSFGLKILERSAVSVPATKNPSLSIIAHSGKCKWSVRWQQESRMEIERV